MASADPNRDDEASAKFRRRKADGSSSLPKDVNASVRKLAEKKIVAENMRRFESAGNGDAKTAKGSDIANNQAPKTKSSSNAAQANQKSMHPSSSVSNLASSERELTVSKSKGGEKQEFNALLKQFQSMSDVNSASTSSSRQRAERKGSDASSGEIKYVEVMVQKTSNSKKPAVPSPAARPEKPVPAARGSEVVYAQIVKARSTDNLADAGNSSHPPRPPAKPPKSKDRLSNPDEPSTSSQVRADVKTKQKGKTYAKQSSIFDNENDPRASTFSGSNEDLDKMVPVLDKSIRQRDDSQSSSSNLKKYRSMELVYDEPTTPKPEISAAEETIYFVKNAIYSEPFGSTHSVNALPDRATNVAIDDKGYAIPSVDSRRVHKKLSSTNKGKKNESPIGGFMPHVHAKVNRAYSVLRPPPNSDSQATHSDDDECSDAEYNRSQFKRMDYVRLTSTTRTNLMGEYYHVGICKTDDSKKLFSLGFIAEAKMGDGRPIVTFAYPHKDEANKLLDFCFPELTMETDQSMKPGKFTFILTNAEGNRQYGHCVRSHSPVSNTTVVTCLLTIHSNQDWFDELIDKIDHLQRLSLNDAKNFLIAAYRKRMPKPGGHVWISVRNVADLLFNLPEKKALNKRIFFALSEHFTHDALAKIFATLLLERRVIIVGSDICTLSQCVRSVESLIYPFTWQHTFVTVLPTAMLEVCAAPTPFVMGILRASQSTVLDLNLEQVLVYSIDERRFLVTADDVAHILPHKLQDALLASLKEDQNTLNANSAVLFETFLHFFVETVGHYRTCFEMQGFKNVFDEKQFLHKPSSRSIRMFLEWFSKTQMFHVFIEERLEFEALQNDLFDMRINQHLLQMAESSRLLRSVRGMRRMMASLFKGSGTKPKKKAVGNTP